MPIPHHKRQELAQMLITHSAMVFKLGAHDCAVLARKSLAMAGRLNLPEWTGERSALALLNGGLLKACERYLGPPGIPSKWSIGDIGYASHDETRFGIILCVFDGAHFVTSKDIGLMSVPRSSIIGGWVA